MRQALKDLITSTLVYRYNLPNGTIKKTNLSDIDDKCYQSGNTDDLCDIIYNSIIEYSFDEFELGEDSLEALHTRALLTRIRYNEDDTDATRLKYGFYGEVLLYAILQVLYDVPPVISRGHFYLPGENSETKGYDSYHLLDNNGQVELWFGEVKFHQAHTQAINSALSNIENVIDDNYLEKRNLVAIFDKVSSNSNYGDSPLSEIVARWKQNPKISLIDELKENSISLIYPIFIISNAHGDGYDETISKWIEYIDENHGDKSFDNISIEYSIYFIFLPVECTRTIKTQTMSWIESNRQLIS